MASAETKPNGSVLIVVSDGNNTAGKKIRKTMLIPAADLAGLTPKQRDKLIEERKVLFERKVKNGTYLDGEKIRLAEFIEIWLTDYAEKELAPKTLHEYKRMIELRIVPALGHLIMSKIQPKALNDFKNSLSGPGARLDYHHLLKDEYKYLLELPEVAQCIDKKTFSRLKAGQAVQSGTADKIASLVDKPVKSVFTIQEAAKELSGKTKNNYHRLISSILATAVQWNVIPYNPAERIAPPKKTKSEAAHYDVEQVLRMLSLVNLEPLEFQAMIYTEIYTGARAGELAAFEWADIDFDKARITISKSLQHLHSLGTYEKEPKTISGNRTITVPVSVLDILASHRKEQAEHRLLYGQDWENTNKVFTSQNGGLIYPHLPSHKFQRFIKKYDLPPLTFHQLRHTNASFLIASGVDLLTVSKRLGHAKPSITSDMYGHLISEAEREASNKLEKMLTVHQLE